MIRIKPCACGSHAKLRKITAVSYAVVCPECGTTGQRVYLDEDHTLCEIQNMSISAWNNGVRKEIAINEHVEARGLLVP